MENAFDQFDNIQPSPSSEFDQFDAAKSITPEGISSQVAASQPPPPPSFAQRIGEDMKKRWENVQRIQNYSQQNPPQDALGGIPALTGVLGQAAGVPFDFINETITSAWNTLAPSEFKKYIEEVLSASGSDFAKTRIGQKALTALSQGLDSWQKLDKSNPVATKALEGLLNISGLKLAGIAEREAGFAVNDLKNITTKLRTGVLPSQTATSPIIESRLSKTIRKAISSVIDLSGEGKHTMKQKSAYLTDAESAIKSILDNKDNLKFTDIITGKKASHNLPIKAKTALTDTAQAIDQTKAQIWPEVQQAMTEANNIGLQVDTQAARNKIDKYINSDFLKRRQRSSSSLIKEGEEVRDSYLSNNGKMSIEEAQKTIRSLNEKLREAKYFTSPSLEDKSKIGLYAAELEGLRESFRETIGKSGSDAMQKYGKLMEIEDDILNQIHTKTAGSGIDYATTFSFLEGLKAATGHGFNPSALGTSHVISAITKSNRKAGNILADMFQSADKLYSKSSMLSKPLTYQGNSLKGAASGIGTGIISAAQPSSSFEDRLRAFDESTGELSQ